MPHSSARRDRRFVCLCGARALCSCDLFTFFLKVRQQVNLGNAIRGERDQIIAPPNSPMPVCFSNLEPLDGLSPIAVSKFQKSAKISSVCGNIFFMPNFRTVLNPTASDQKMAISDQVMTVGSCFSDSMGVRLRANKIHAATNPAGIMYNPVSIHRVLEYAIQHRLPADDTFLTGDVVLNYDFHSELNGSSREELESTLQAVLAGMAGVLQNASWLMITYGTAWVYVRRDNGSIVANCHKVPQTRFSRSLLRVDTIVSSFDVIYKLLKKYNPALRILLTVSPVRHLKETLEGNALSKSTLRLACHEITQRLPEVRYFPAYEIMMDDLRDYRFYKADMIHPNDVAEDYIWEKFAAAYFDKSLQEFVTEWSDIQKGLQHRPFHPGSDSHSAFLNGLLIKLEKFSGYVDITEEREYIKKQLAECKS